MARGSGFGSDRRARLLGVLPRSPRSGGSTANLLFPLFFPPTLISVTPGAGSALGGTSVSLTGSNFLQGATVTFGGIAATGVVVTPTHIIATTAAHVASTVNVVVTNPDGQSSTLVNGFVYQSPIVVGLKGVGSGNITQVYSLDGGFTWTDGTTFNSGIGFAGENVIFDGSLFWTCPGNHIWSSPDGVNWTNQAVTVGSSNPCLGYNGTTYVVFSGTGVVFNIQTAPDCLVWTLRSNSLGEQVSGRPVWNGTVWLGAGTSNGSPRQIPKSSNANASAWAFGGNMAITNGVDPDLIAVRKSDGRIICVDAGIRGSWHSEDNGTTWAAVNSPATFGFKPQGIDCNGVYFCFVPAGANAATSVTADGVTWTAGSGFTHAAFHSVCWSPALNKWLAGDSAGQVWTSSDGKVWIQVSSLGNATPVFALCAAVLLPL
jgi:hypothetical protein